MSDLKKLRKMSYFNSSRFIQAGFLTAIAGGLISFTGCKLGPDYQRPDVTHQIPEAFEIPEGFKLAEPQDTADKGNWWERFDDPELNALIAQAREVNGDLLAAQARVAQARAISDASSASLFPWISLNPSAERNRRSGSNPNAPAAVQGRTVNNFRLPLVMSYELDLWGRVRRSFEVAEARTEQQVAAEKSVDLILQTELAIQYFSLRALDAELNTIEQGTEIRKRALELNQLRYQAGDIDEVDVARAKTELALTLAQWNDLNRQRAERANAIAALIGKPSSGFEIQSRPLEKIGTIEAPDMIASELLERRPDIAQAERQLQAANAGIGIAKAAFFPSVSITGSIGLETSVIENLFDMRSRTWGLGPSISLPIFQGGRNNAEYRRALAVYEEALANYRQTIINAVRDVENAIQSSYWIDQQVEQLQLASQSAHRTVDLSQKRYDSGLVAYFDVVDAQRTELEAQQNLARAQGSQYLAYIALVRATGGDVEMADSDTDTEK